MSYEYFLQAHVKGAPQGIPTERILEVFKDYIVAKEETFIDLEFSEGNSCSIYLETEEPNNSGFMISRPCGDKLGECLYAVMLLGNFVFFEPDGFQMIVVAPDVEAHLPEDMVASLGKPVVATDLKSFLELYANNRE
ncbi:hypothetical protein [Dinghuibacter silviterrae]|uniref:Uncharacterized protein n=1 Tax=Dinghuibacter silviterrae TaxID=1539049 RepID=A0A4R8DR33_9BACT|nr:hypothetical protein [Dinghuibacter silviterrae]TDX00632.1 hypothetical protein EDB95_1657 [Dinghuibacter silviterrae]